LVNSLSRFQSHIAGCSCVMSTCTLNEYEWMNEWMNEGCSHLAKSMSWSSHIAECKNSIRHIENRFFSPYFCCFLCSLSFDERRLSYRLRYTCLFRKCTCR